LETPLYWHLCAALKPGVTLTFAAGTSSVRMESFAVVYTGHIGLPELFGSPVLANWVQYPTIAVDRACSSALSIKGDGVAKPKFQMNWSSLACAA